MELTLNIYEKKKIIKTYTAETYDLMFGTVEDFINVIDINNIDLENKESLIKMASKVVVSALDIIKPLLKDVFDGLTDAELINTKISEIVEIIIQIIKFAIKEMGKGFKQKN